MYFISAFSAGLLFTFSIGIDLNKSLDEHLSRGEKTDEQQKKEKGEKKVTESFPSNFYWLFFSTYVCLLDVSLV